LDQLAINVLVGIALIVGVIGTVLPIVPGAFLCAGAVVVWAFSMGAMSAWAVACFAVGLVLIGTVLKYWLPGRQLRASGVPWWVLALAGLLGIIGFFVIPIVGLFVGFILGVYLGELMRLRDRREAWPTTVAALKAVGFSMLIDLTAAMLASVAWFAAVWIV